MIKVCKTILGICTRNGLKGQEVKLVARFGHWVEIVVLWVRCILIYVYKRYILIPIYFFTTT